VLRTQSAVRALAVADQDEALAVCARNPVDNVFVAARILEGALRTQPGSLVGYEDEAAGTGALQALCWTSANLVPVEADSAALLAFAARTRRWRRQCSSVFGVAEQVLPLWRQLSSSWGRPRATRPVQPLLAMSATPRSRGVAVDDEVRPARFREVDLVLPAAAAMFTEEIGVPPFRGSDSVYRQSLEALITRGHTFVRVENGEVVFKADVGSVAGGVAQIQGVWVAPAHRGKGMAAPAMAAVVEQVQAGIAPVASLYVNDFNAAARAAYKRVGFEQVGTFATILL
jgi:predicted GNAT family acetyltransferase